MAIKSLTKKIKLARIKKVRTAPRWVDIRKFGIKRARTRRVNVDKIKKWRKIRLRV
jgi:hypothetical protein